MGIGTSHLSTHDVVLSKRGDFSECVVEVLLQSLAFAAGIRHLCAESVQDTPGIRVS